MGGGGLRAEDGAAVSSVRHGAEREEERGMARLIVYAADAEHWGMDVSVNRYANAIGVILGCSYCSGSRGGRVEEQGREGV